MKYLQSYNESIRDKMVAKPIEDVITTDTKMLNYAIENKELNIIKQMVKRGYNINYALNTCLWFDYYAGVEWCLENGADPFQNGLTLMPSARKSAELIQKYRNEDIKDFLDKKKD